MLSTKTSETVIKIRQIPPLHCQEMSHKILDRSADVTTAQLPQVCVKCVSSTSEPPFLEGIRGLWSYFGSFGRELSCWAHQLHSSHDVCKSSTALVIEGASGAQMRHNPSPSLVVMQVGQRRVVEHLAERDFLAEQVEQ